MDVGGRAWHVRDVGEGPVVVFEAGGASWSLDAYAVEQALAGAARVVSYDRAGFGWSDPPVGPRDAATLADELAAVLVAADVPPPYLLVGASFGGHVVRRFAAVHPEDVRGLVLLDARHEDLDAAMPPAWARLQRVAAGVQRVLGCLAAGGLLGLVARLGGARAVPPALRHLPPALRPVYLEVGFTPTYFSTNLAELAAVATSDAQLRAAPPPRHLPVVVVRHGVPDLFVALGADAPAAEARWQALQDALAASSDAATLVVAERAGHAIQLDDPDLVAAVVRDLLARTAIRSARA